MAAQNPTAREAYFHPDDPAGRLKPGEPFIVDGLDWSWAFVSFKPVQDFPPYCIGSNGTVWTLWERRYPKGRIGVLMVIGETWKRMKSKHKGRHRQINLCYEEIRLTVVIHHLVLEAFIGPCPPGMEGCHFDDNPYNNRLSNLRWDTSEENKADALRNGLMPIGEANGKAKLSNSQVLEMRETYAIGGVSQKELAEKYDVPQTNVSAIVTGRAWQHVGGPITKYGRGRQQIVRPQLRGGTCP
jgi:HNH endonuclease